MMALSATTSLSNKRIEALEKAGLKIIGPWTRMIVEERAAQLPLFYGHDALDDMLGMLDAHSPNRPVMPDRFAGLSLSMEDDKPDTLRAKILEALGKMPNARLDGNNLIIDAFTQGSPDADVATNALVALEKFTQGANAMAGITMLSGGLAAWSAANTAKRVLSPDNMREIFGEDGIEAENSLPQQGHLAQLLQRKAASTQQALSQQWQQSPEMKEMLQQSMESAMELFSIFAAAGNEEMAMGMLSQVAAMQEQLNRMQQQQLGLNN
jgi:hypothetical protein